MKLTAYLLPVSIKNAKFILIHSTLMFQLTPFQRWLTPSIKGCALCT